jgi:hypothetical protein
VVVATQAELEATKEKLVGARLAAAAEQKAAVEKWKVETARLEEELRQAQEEAQRAKEAGETMNNAEELERLTRELGVAKQAESAAKAAVSAAKASEKAATEAVKVLRKKSMAIPEVDPHELEKARTQLMRLTLDFEAVRLASYAERANLVRASIKSITQLRGHLSSLLVSLPPVIGLSRQAAQRTAPPDSTPEPARAWERPPSSPPSKQLTPSKSAYFLDGSLARGICSGLNAPPKSSKRRWRAAEEEQPTPSHRSPSFTP